MAKLSKDIESLFAKYDNMDPITSELLLKAIQHVKQQENKQEKIDVEDYTNSYNAIRKEMIDKWNCGVSVRSMVLEYGVSQSTIYNILKDNISSNSSVIKKLIGRRSEEK